MANMITVLKHTKVLHKHAKLQWALTGRTTKHYRRLEWHLLNSLCNVLVPIHYKQCVSQHITASPSNKCHFSGCFCLYIFFTDDNAKHPSFFLVFLDLSLPFPVFWFELANQERHAQNTLQFSCLSFACLWMFMFRIYLQMSIHFNVFFVIVVVLWKKNDWGEREREKNERRLLLLVIVIPKQFDSTEKRLSGREKERKPEQKASELDSCVWVLHCVPVER